MQSRTHASAQLHRDLFENSTPDYRLLYLDLAIFEALTVVKGGRIPKPQVLKLRQLSLPVRFH